MAESGIYEIVNRVNGKRYVGSAVNLPNRWRQHKCELRKGRHNPHFQASWDKHGPEAFEFHVIEIVHDKKNLLVREQYFIDSLSPEYNCAKVAGSRLGQKVSPETLAKISRASKAIWAADGHRQKMADAHRGQKLTEEQRAKISAALKGRMQSEGHRAKTAARNRDRNTSENHRSLMSAFWKGRSKTDEQIAKMAATKRGTRLSEDHKSKVSSSLKRAYDSGERVQIISPETRAKISAALTGRKASAATIEKLRGRKQSAATKIKRSESLKRAWAEGRRSRAQRPHSGDPTDESGILYIDGSRRRR